MHVKRVNHVRGLDIQVLCTFQSTSFFPYGLKRCCCALLAAPWEQISLHCLISPSPWFLALNPSLLSYGLSSPCASSSTYVECASPAVSQHCSSKTRRDIVNWPNVYANRASRWILLGSWKKFQIDDYLMTFNIVRRLLFDFFHPQQVLWNATQSWLAESISRADRW